MEKNRINRLARKFAIGALMMGILGALIWHDPQTHDLGVFVMGFAMGSGQAGIMFWLASRR